VAAMNSSIVCLSGRGDCVAGDVVRTSVIRQSGGKILVQFVRMAGILKDEKGLPELGTIGLRSAV
jgi:hypothetical protein